MRRDGGSVFPAHANTGDPNGPIEACPLIRTHALMQDRSPPVRRNHLQRTAGPYMWVKLRRTQYEHMFSALPSNSDIARRSRHVSNVPIRTFGGSCGSTNLHHP